MLAMDQNNSARNTFKGKNGLLRLRNAVRYSLSGYRFAWQDEEAFRQITLVNLIGIPVACAIAESWTHFVLLGGVLVLSMIVELLNSAIENVVDRISLDEHLLSQKAKDIGSAAQFTAQLLIAAVWGSYLLRKMLF